MLPAVAAMHSHGFGLASRPASHVTAIQKEIMKTFDTNHRI